VQRILDAAAQFRLQRKANAICQKMENHGRDEALFQEIAAALGYKENKLPFTLVAQRLTLKQLRSWQDDSEAILFGVAGFLQKPDLSALKGPAKKYVRELWDRWWPHRDEFERLILSPGVWKSSSTRPSNHPQRRLAAVSVLVRKWPKFHRLITEGPSRDRFSPREKNTMRALKNFLGNLDHPFWKSHYTLTAAPCKTEMALIGESRIAEIFANVIFPFWWAENAASPPIERSRPAASSDGARSAQRADPTDSTWAEYSKLPARLTNRRLETGAVRLFGDDPRRKEFLRTVAHQQGLLQIFEDFCLQDNSDCAQCPFPEQMQQWL
jgi:hypothetical protein